MQAARVYYFARLLTLCSLVFMIGCGVLMCIYEIKPFWIDEWRLILNLKFKSSAGLWGVLDHNQQCPRLYLQFLKVCTAAGNYSYHALRLPSMVVHSLSLCALYFISGRIFRPLDSRRFLWVLMFMAFNTSLHYFVQIKQYSMEMAMAVLGFAQLWMLIKQQQRTRGQKMFLAITFFLGPLLSYTYPVVAVPLFFTLWLIRFRHDGFLKPIMSVAAYLVAFTAGITILYFTDLQQVFRHQFMQDFWASHLMRDGFSLTLFARNIYWLFAQMGAGDLFENIYFILGLAAWIWANVRIVGVIRGRDSVRSTPYGIYAVSMVNLCVILFLCHKLPIGAHRVNAFMVPAIAWMVVDLLQEISNTRIRGLAKSTTVLSALLFLAAIGNVISTFILDLTDQEHRRLMAVYNNCRQSIHVADSLALPIAATPEVGYPLQVEVNGDWVLKAQPAYPAVNGPIVYPIGSVSALDSLIKAMPIQSLPKGFVVLDGAKHSVFMLPR